MSCRILTAQPGAPSWRSPESKVGPGSAWAGQSGDGPMARVRRPDPCSQCSDGTKAGQGITSDSLAAAVVEGRDKLPPSLPPT